MLLDSSISDVADSARRKNLTKNRGERAELGQFLTPMPVAGLMAGMFGKMKGRIRLLDPGAGSGALTAAFVAEMAGRKTKPTAIEAVCYEVDRGLIAGLRRTLIACTKTAAAAGIKFSYEIVAEDFIAAGVLAAKPGSSRRFDAVIMNPPYRKIGTASIERATLGFIGIETVNLYAGFMAVAVRLLVDGGWFVAISPRSFCNGPYYRSFRQGFLGAMAIARVHVFASRSAAFGDDAVLQENIIVAATRAEQADDDTVTVSESVGVDDVRTRCTVRSAMVKPGDPESFIHIHTDAEAERVSSLFDRMTVRIADLGLTVSTGPVVDFRHKGALSAERVKGAIPLFWPRNCRDGATTHPAECRKPQWIRSTSETDRWLTANERFVIIKRFSAKEERRRVVAVVHDPASVRSTRIGLENHLNFIHRDGRGLAPDLAAGIAAYLNSGLIDTYFRQFNGHTQVNATDLRTLPFPSAAHLERLGKAARRDVTNPTIGDALILTLSKA